MQRQKIQERRPNPAPEAALDVESVHRDANGLLKNKDGFYLRESDDEEDAPEVVLSKK